MNRWTRVLAATLLTGVVGGCGSSERDPKLLRVGHFPNLTHAQGLIGHVRTDGGKKSFESRLPAGTRIEWYVYNAGPSAMEAILSGALDLAYVGPNPALNAHMRTKGEEIRVVAGSARGGAGLVVPAASTAKVPADFRGKRIGTPQLGNTQDVACRAWLTAGGLKVTQTGGDATIVPTQNPDQLDLFRRGSVDAVWTVEPWVARLEIEGGGRLLVEEPEALTTVLVASARSLRERPEMVRSFVAAHRELTEWIVANPEDARREVGEAVARIAGAKLPPEVAEKAWSRLRFGSDVSVAEFETFVTAARTAGFLPDAVPLTRLVEKP